MNVQYLGHSCFMLTGGGCMVLFDPFLSGNPLATAKPETLNPTHICVSHAHGDHIGDAAAIAERTGATVYTTPEVAGLLGDVKKVAGNIGGTAKTEFGWVKYLAATHSSGVAGGTATGFLLDIGGVKVYYAGDTGLMTDMQLLAKDKVDIAFLPIGGFYTMDSMDAATAVELIRPKCAVPMHYNTFPLIAADPEAFRTEVRQRASAVKVRILAPGESFDYSLE